MPPKEKLTREEIIEGAFCIIREEGYDALSARSLASRLSCSTMPLFRHFENMEEIRSLAIEMALKKYSEYIQRGLNTELPFKGSAMAYIRFAKEEPKLFQLLLMTSNQLVPTIPTEFPNQNEVLKAGQFASGLSRAETEAFHRELWIFIHGIATLIVTRVMEFEEETISRMLTNVFLGLKSHYLSCRKGESKND